MRPRRPRPPTSQKNRPTETAGAHAPNSTEAGLAMSAGLFNRDKYVKGGRTGEWRLIQEEGEARANAWQDLKVCRCHGQCGAKRHRIRRTKPCQHEGTVKCKDFHYGFTFFLCQACACHSCKKKQGYHHYQGLCQACWEGDLGWSLNSAWLARNGGMQKRQK